MILFVEDIYDHFNHAAQVHIVYKQLYQVPHRDLSLIEYTSQDRCPRANFDSKCLRRMFMMYEAYIALSYIKRRLLGSGRSKVLLERALSVIHNETEYPVFKVCRFSLFVEGSVYRLTTYINELKFKVTDLEMWVKLV